MVVLSLFDGISCGRVALQRAGIPVTAYYACEIDKHAIKVSFSNWPDIIQLGSVTELHDWAISVLPEIDLLIGGSPCQGFSFAGKQLNFNDPRSALFFEFVRIWKAVKLRNPKAKFLLENVPMKERFRDVITGCFDVPPVMINSNAVSAQNRRRWYWTDICKLDQPTDTGILLKDILINSEYALFQRGHGTRKQTILLTDKTTTVKPNFYRNYYPVDIEKLVLTEKALEYMDRQVKGGRTHWDFHHHSDVRDSKSSALVANLFKGVPYNVLRDWDCIRKFHPIECERLQGLPDNYTAGISDTQRYKCLGNGWQVDTIMHIFKNLI